MGRLITSQRKLFGLLELDTAGTVLYSRIEAEAGSDGSPSDMTGQNFSSEVASFRASPSCSSARPLPSPSLKVRWSAISHGDVVMIQDHPAVSPKATLAAVPREAQASPQPARPTALVVEDDDGNRLVIKLLMKMWGYDVVEARDGREGVEAAERERPDLILLDARLPRLSGLEAARRIRVHESLGKVPIVFVSGHATAADEAEALAAGGDAYVTKPFEPDLLRLVVEGLTAGGRRPAKAVAGS